MRRPTWPSLAILSLLKPSRGRAVQRTTWNMHFITLIYILYSASNLCYTIADRHYGDSIFIKTKQRKDKSSEALDICILLPWFTFCILYATFVIPSLAILPLLKPSRGRAVLRTTWNMHEAMQDTASIENLLTGFRCWSWFHPPRGYSQRSPREGLQHDRHFIFYSQLDITEHRCDQTSNYTVPFNNCIKNSTLDILCQQENINFGWFSLQRYDFVTK